MKPNHIFIIASLIFTFFLGFIDEGYYDFTTYTKPANWLILSCYFLLFWLTQNTFYTMLKKFEILQNIRVKISIIIGLLLPIAIIMIVAAKLSF